MKTRIRENELYQFRIVQNNSVAAEETSATSEELTAQATTLSGMVSVFKLRQ